MKKRFFAAIMAATIATSLITGCGQKENGISSETEVNSLLVDADKESVDYAKESEDKPVYEDTDYEYHSDTDAFSDSDISSDTNTEVSSDINASGDNGDNGSGSGSGNDDGSGNSGGSGEESGNEVSVAPKHEIYEENQCEYFIVNGTRFSICNFNLDEFEGLIGNSLEFVSYDENLKYDGYFSDQGNFTKGYWTNGKGSTKMYVEIGQDNEITAVVITDLAQSDTGRIAYGDGTIHPNIGVRRVELNKNTTDSMITGSFGDGDSVRNAEYLTRTYSDNRATAVFLMNEDERNSPVKELIIRRN